MAQSIKWLACFLFILNLYSTVTQDFQVYYDKNWNPVPLIDGDTEQAVNLKTDQKRYGFLPCNCENLQCECCANMNFLSANRSGCMNLAYDPDEFAINMNMLFNGESVYQNSLSAKNPPPACMEVPIPYIPSVQFCIRMFDIYTPGRNLHVCINFETRLSRAPILVLEFDCVVMGFDGLSHVKPTSSSESPSRITTTESAQVEVDKPKKVTSNDTQMNQKNESLMLQ